MIRLINKFCACHIGWKSRMMRASSGIILNLLVLFAIDYIPPVFFWSIIIVSYMMVLEAFAGCSLAHWVYKITNK